MAGYARHAPGFPALREGHDGGNQGNF